MARNRPLIAVTIGDPAGIGPEVVLAALADTRLRERCVPVVVGHAGLLRRCAEVAGISAGDVSVVASPAECRQRSEGVQVVHVESPGIQEIVPGQISADAGRAVDAFIRRACELALAGQVDAISTAPINKESLRLAGIPHIGHTEMLEAYLAAPDPLTVFVTGRMRIFFLSRHLSLRQALDFVTLDNVLPFIRRVHLAMMDLGFPAPAIALAGLNPHASDGGQFGDEEERHLIPAAVGARAEGIDVTGPIGADSVFAMAADGRFDCVISLYHDQGHIAAKTRDFAGTVTATLGLGVLRTSVDHGTAFDIAWQGRADSTSMAAAILAAADMLSAR